MNSQSPLSIFAEAASLSEQAYHALRRDIVSGVFPPDSPLRLEALKNRYGLSFSPLREALSRLHSEHLVVSTVAKGFRVAPHSETEMWDAIETRILIDCEALRRSLLNGDDSWEARLIGAYHALLLATERRHKLDENSPQLQEHEEILESRHQHFHECLISACDSTLLKNFSTQLYAQTDRYRRPNLRDRKRWSTDRKVDDEHKILMDAALARDAKQASKLLARHYRATGETVIRLQNKETSPEISSAKGAIK